MKKSKIFLVGAVLLLSTNAFTQSEESVKACLMKICGDAKEVANPPEKLVQFLTTESSFDSTIKNEILPLVDQYVKLDAASDRKMLKLIEGNYQKILDRPVSPSALVLLNYLRSIRIMTNYLKYFTVKDMKKGFELNYDNKEIKEELAKITADPKKSRELVITELIINVPSFIETILSSQASMTPLIFFEVVYPGLSLDEALKKDLAELEKKEAVVLNAFPFVKDQVGSSNGYRSVKKNGTFTSVASGREYLRMRGEIVHMYDFLTDERLRPVRTMETKVSDMVSLDGYYNALKRFESKTNPKFVAARAELAKRACFSSLRMGLNSSPSDLQKAEIRKKLDFIKKAAVEVGSKIITVDKEVLAKKVAAIDYFLPDSPAQMIKGTMEYFNNLVAEEKRDAAKYRNSDLSDEYLFLMAIGQISSPTSITDASDGAITNYCKELAPSPYPNDFALQASGRIRVSWQSFFYDQVGSGIIAHETGHAVHLIIEALAKNNLLNKLEFAGKKLCIDGQQPGTKDYKYFTEDFADAFSATIMGEGAANFACTFFPQENGDFKYSQIKMPAEKDDTHSSHLFRALHFYSYGKPLPQECTVLLEKQEKPMHLQRCI
jgi:hypothetical protein